MARVTRSPFTVCVAMSALWCAGGCPTPVVTSPVDTEESTDQVNQGGEPSPEVTSPEPRAECDAVDPASCPDGMYCHGPSRQCVACLFTKTRCGADGERERCEEPIIVRDGELLGGVYTSEPCEANTVCVQGTSEASCQPRVCAPGLERCQTVSVAEVCNGTGTAWTQQPCFPGWACHRGQCEMLRHNVLLIFDTSGSMYAYADLTGNPGEESCRENQVPCASDAPFPSCEHPGLPHTLFTQAKEIFRENIQEAVGEFARFALQRFPQRVNASMPASCLRGWYEPLEFMTGDDGALDTSESTWFEAHLDEVVVVPFAGSLGADNTEQLARWLDFSEELGPTTQSCDPLNNGWDCPSLACGSSNGEPVCFAHTDPELRIGAQTPLGESLFYAGEYFRRFVLIDGKPCSSDNDCPSAGYACVEQTCQDPYAGCRDNFIILFTDGSQYPIRDDADFLHPTNQAKRLAYGLSCSSDLDCRGGAECRVLGGNGYCIPADSEAWIPDDTPYVAATGHDALSRLDGSPISIKTTVVNLQGVERRDDLGLNDAIARWGAGALVEVSAMEPEDWKTRLYDVMTPAFKCEPEDL